MKQQASRMQRVLVIVNFLLFAAVLFVGFRFWINGVFDKHLAVPHAIYATGSLVNTYHVVKAKTGKWPDPGTVAAKEVSFVRSFYERGVRVDAFDFGGQYALIYVRERSLDVLPVTRLPSRPTDDAREPSVTTKPSS